MHQVVVITLFTLIFSSYGWGPRSAINKSKVNASTPAKASNTVCYENLGCFTTYSYTDLLKNPKLMTPMSPDRMSISFNLFKCDNKFRPVVFTYNQDDEFIKNSIYVPTNNTIIFTHGYLSFYDEMEWMGDMKDYLLSSCETNVFALDWSKGASEINYFQSAANLRVVAAMTAFFINRLINATNTSPDRFTLIGHSLGSHLSGFVGKRFKDPKIARIIGLDPAGPAFTAVDHTYRLDKTDASLVMVIHTDIRGFGNVDNVAHFDFFPNGGIEQPGCEVTRGVSEFLLKGTTGLTNQLSCNHGRAQSLAIADPSMIKSSDNAVSCEMVAYECDNYKSFRGGNCTKCGYHNNKCRLMPFSKDYFDIYNTEKGNETNKRFFIETKGTVPYCLYHYGVQFYTANDSSEVTGLITISLYGEKRDKPGIQMLQREAPFKKNQRYTYLLTYPKDLGRVEKATIKWNFRNWGTVNKLVKTLTRADRHPPIKIEKMKVNFMSNNLKSIRKKYSSKLCYNKMIGDGETATFEICKPLNNQDMDLKINRHDDD